MYVTLSILLLLWLTSGAVSQVANNTDEDTTVKCLFSAVGTADVLTFTKRSYDFNYTFAKLETRWELTGFSDVADRIVRLSRKSLPFQALRSLVSSLVSNSSDSMNDITTDLLIFEAPYIAMSACAVLAALVVPVVGLTLCCGRFQGFCKEEIDDVDVGKLRKHHRFIHANMVIIGATLTLISGIALFMVSERLDEGIHVGREISVETLDNAATFFKQSGDSLTHILEADFNLAIDYAVEKLNKIPQVVSVHIASSTKTKALAAFEKIRSLDMKIRELYPRFSEAAFLLAEIGALESIVTLQLRQLQVELDFFIANCTAVLSASQCEILLPQQAELVKNDFLDFAPVLNGSTTFMERNMKTRMENASTHLDNIASSIAHEVYNARDIVDKLTATMREAKDDILNQILVTMNTAYWIMDFIKSQMLQTNFSVAEMLVSIALKIPAVVTLIMAAFLITAVCAGQLGATHSASCTVDELGKPMKLARLGKDLIFSYAYMFFVISFVFQVMLAVSAPLSANLINIKSALTDRRIFTEFIDDQRTWGGKTFLSMLIHSDPNSAPLKMHDFLEECRKKKTLWSILRFENMFNLTGFTDVSKKLTPEDVFDVKSLISLSTYLPSEVLDINATLQLNLQVVNISTASNAPVHIVGYNSSKVISNFRSFYLAQLNDYADLAMQAMRVETMLKSIHESAEFLAYENRANRLTNVTGFLLHEVRMLLQNQSAIVKEIGELINCFNTHAEDLASDSLLQAIDSVTRSLVSYGEHAVRELTTEVGQCQIFPKTYDRLTTFIFYYVTESLNSLWLALGTCTFAFLAFLPSYLELARHYQIAALDFQLQSSEDKIESVVVVNRNAAETELLERRELRFWQ